ISLKQKLREAVTRMVTLLAHYVEVACNNDPAVFETSGFVAVLSTRTPAQPLPPAGFDWIDRGPTSGSILVQVRTIPKAGLYELGFAVCSSGAAGPWSSLTSLSPKTVTVNGLEPGATYAFQVRALGRLGYTNWSDSTTFICG